MENIEEISLHYLKKLAEMDKEKNDVYVRNGEHRTIFFWLADDLGKKLGLDHYDVDKIITFLSKHHLVYWRSTYQRTLELTDKGYNWHLHLSLFEKPKTETNITNVTNNQIMSNKNNPWISGSFYLTVLIVILVALAVIANQVAWYALPIVLIASILMIGIIGALQLRNDDKLKEEGFLKLMSETYKRLPLLKSSSKPEGKEEKTTGNKT